jgi:hypothetical protein
LSETICKYPLDIAEKQEIEIPVDSKIIHVDVQNDSPVIWAIVNPENPREDK